MKLIKTTIIFLSLIAVFGLAKNASATTITSTSGGGTWSDNGTWSGGVAPTATDTVIIATTGGNSVNLGVGTTAANITINAGAILNANSYQLTDSGDFTFSGAFIFGTSTLQMTGSSASISNSGGSAPQFNNLIINSAGTGPHFQKCLEREFFLPFGRCGHCGDHRLDGRASCQRGHARPDPKLRQVELLSGQGH